MATRFMVLQNGEETVYTVKPKHILKVERETGGLEANIESSYKLAFLATGSELSFEEWLDGVDDIEPMDEDEEPRPTKGGSRN